MATGLGVTFCDFWPELDQENNAFINSLRRITRVRIDHINPDLVFFSFYGNTHFRYRCPKVFYTGENIRPDYHACDFSISFDYPVTVRNFRLPLYALYGDIKRLCLPKNPIDILKSKIKFCNFIVSNPQGKERNKFFKLLNKYKRVDSGGRFLNNLGYCVEDKNKFIHDYKFTLAFENSSYPGYTTEKLFQPMLMHSLPIYWGNPLVSRDFNSRSFINIHDYSDFESTIEHIIDIDKHDELYLKYLEEPYFEHNTPNEYVVEGNLDHFFENLLSMLPGLSPVGDIRIQRIKAQYNYKQRRISELADFSIRNIRRLINI